jgi:hypothetical protein
VELWEKQELLFLGGIHILGVSSFSSMFSRIFSLLFCWYISIQQIFAETLNLNVRDISVGNTGNSNPLLQEFISPISNFFFSPETTGWEGIYNIFITIAFQIKNVFIAIAVIFLIIAVIKLLFSPGSEEDVKKWRENIIYVSVGIFIMQISFSVWNTLLIRNSYDTIGAMFGYNFWINVLAPIVRLLQMLASFAFIMMMFYAFYVIVTGGWEEEKLKKWRTTFIYALFGFLLIKIPETFVRAIYGSPSCQDNGWLTIGNCEIQKQNLSGAVDIIAKIFNFLNTFLTIICIILIIYAGWLVFISAWDDEKIKKAKNIVLYLIVGLILLVASHALFRFFILG